MLVYDRKNGRTKKVVDECVTPKRKDCRGCKYSIDPKYRDGGCGLHFKTEWLRKYGDIIDTVELEDVYAVITESLHSLN